MRDAAIAYVRYRDRATGLSGEWSIGAHATKDTDATIRAHAAFHWPTWEVLSVRIVPDQPREGSDDAG
jgi:hypothetical protein